MGCAATLSPAAGSRLPGRCEPPPTGTASVGTVTWRVKFRREGRVEQLSAASLDEALALLEERARSVAAGPRRAPVDLRVRRFEPVHQVAARAEVSGPRGARAGL